MVFQRKKADIQDVSLFPIHKEIQIALYLVQDQLSCPQHTRIIL